MFRNHSANENCVGFINDAYLLYYQVDLSMISNALLCDRQSFLNPSTIDLKGQKEKRI